MTKKRFNELLKRILVSATARLELNEVKQGGKT
jgi:hypothetical protein